jgi:hypothetical protein
MPHRVGLDVGAVLDLAPHRELGRVVGAKGKGRHHLEADLAGAEGVEQLGRQLAEAQPLPDVPFGYAEAKGDRFDRLAGVDQRGHGDKFVGRMHGGAHRVFHQRGFERLFGLLDQARHLEIRRDRALGRELLQRLEAAAAGDDRMHVFRVERGGMNCEILLETPGPDAGLELGLFGRRRRRLAHIGRGQHELVERDVADFGCGGHGWGLPVTSGREPSLALENPSQIPSRPSSSRALPRAPLPAGEGEGGPQSDHAVIAGSAASGAGSPRRKASR